MAALERFTIYKFKSISAIPDEFVGLTPRPLLWRNGKRVEFSAAAIIREQNRGLGCE